MQLIRSEDLASTFVHYQSLESTLESGRRNHVLQIFAIPEDTPLGIARKQEKAALAIQDHQ